LKSIEGKNNVHRIKKQIAKSWHDVVAVNCVKYSNGKVVIESDHVKEEWHRYTEKLLNKEDTQDNNTTCKKVEVTCQLIRRDKILKE